MRRRVWSLTTALVLFAACCASAQSGWVHSEKEREFPFSDIDVRQVLRDLGAYNGMSLDSLDGMVRLPKSQLSAYEKASCTYHLELITTGYEKTLVRVNADITAAYTDPGSGASEVRTLLSNGKLEQDLLDRLQVRLSDRNPDLTNEIAGLDRQINETRARKVQLQQSLKDLQAEVEKLRQTPRPAPLTLNLAAVKHDKAAVLREPKAGAPLFRAVTDDEFEVVSFRDDWVQVKLGGKESGWIRRSDVGLLQDDASASPAAAPAHAAGEFAVTRENVNVFMGNWSGLRGRKALFLYASPMGVSSSGSSRDQKLSYVKQLFADRYRSAVHSDQRIEGVVVVFLGGGGGVAAATLQDIGRWVGGELAEPAFLERCSLDLPLQ